MARNKPANFAPCCLLFWNKPLKFGVYLKLRISTFGLINSPQCHCSSKPIESKSILTTHIHQWKAHVCVQISIYEMAPLNIDCQEYNMQKTASSTTHTVDVHLATSVSKIYITSDITLPKTDTSREYTSMPRSRNQISKT